MFNEAKIVVGDNRKTLASLPAGLIQTCITSPPYWGLRDYGQDDQIGLEDSPEAFVEQLCLVFDEVWRVLADDGTLWLNLGDSYVGTGSKGDLKDPKYPEGRNGQAVAVNNKVTGLKSKDLVGIPWRVAFALQARGWFLRSEIIWHKPNPMPESVTDRPTKSHEHIFLLSKSAKYFYDHEAIKEPVSGDWGTRDRTNGKYHNEGTGLNPHKGLEKEYDSRNKRDVWSVPTQGFPGAHFAVYPPALIEPCVLAGSRAGDTVLDPFSGSGTTGMVALRNGRNYVGCELNPEYAALSKQRIGDDCGMFGDVTVHLDA
jgi:DNA modification methylase